IAVGTGGNINKIFELALQRRGEEMPLTKILEVQSYVQSLTMEERINDLQLNTDRADVIIPASEIYVSAMKWAGATNIIVPDVGLKDGLMFTLYLRNSEQLT
ncbi:MAG: phosphatase, partial [Bacteroidota bacterium]